MIAFLDMSQKNKHHFQGKECFSRMNFLYQASMLMAGRNNTLSSYYGQLCRNVGKKAVLRLDPEIKRNICKRCSLAQKPGVTADLSVRQLKCKKRKQQHTATINVDEGAQMILKCQQCGHQRNYNVNPNYEFWLEKTDSVAEVVSVDESGNQLDDNSCPVAAASISDKWKVVIEKNDEIVTSIKKSETTSEK